LKYLHLLEVIQIILEKVKIFGKKRTEKDHGLDAEINYS
jgi:hypothetical protein